MGLLSFLNARITTTTTITTTTIIIITIDLKDSKENLCQVDLGSQDLEALAGSPEQVDSADSLRKEDSVDSPEQADLADSLPKEDSVDSPEQADLVENQRKEVSEVVVSIRQL